MLKTKYIYLTLLYLAATVIGAKAAIFEVTSNNAPIYFANKIEGYLTPKTLFTPLSEKDGKYLLQVYLDGRKKLYVWVPIDSVQLVNGDENAVHTEKVHAYPIVNSLQQGQFNDAALNTQGEQYQRSFSSDSLSEEDLQAMAQQIEEGKANQRAIDDDSYRDRQSDLVMKTYGQDIHPEGAETRSKKQTEAPDIDPSLGKVPTDTPENPTVSQHVLPPATGNTVANKTYGKGTKKMEIQTEQVLVFFGILVVGGGILYLFATHDHKKKRARPKLKK